MGNNLVIIYLIKSYMRRWIIVVYQGQSNIKTQPDKLSIKW